jgi:hypothetical protein
MLGVLVFAPRSAAKQRAQQRSRNAAQRCVLCSRLQWLWMKRIRRVFRLYIE